MNAKTKKATVKKYAGQFEDELDLIEALKADENEFTDEEINEILPEIALKTDDPAPAPAPKKEGKVSKKPAFDAWYSRINKDGSYEKLKKEKEGILITEEQAAILNEGVLNGSNAHGLVYLPAE